MPEQMAFFSIAIGDKDQNGQADVVINAQVFGIQLVSPTVHNVSGASFLGLFSALKGFIALGRKLIPGL